MKILTWEMTHGIIGTEKAYDYLASLDWIKNLELDKVMIVDTINDESQTVYGEQTSNEKTNYKAYGVSAMGFDNYQDIIQSNGNPADVTVATIGYGGCIDNNYHREAEF